MLLLSLASFSINADTLEDVRDFHAVPLPDVQMTPQKNTGLLTSVDSTVQVVYPDQFTPVTISSRDVNYLKCNDGYITSRTFSEEKPLMYEKGQKDDHAFLKLKTQVFSDGVVKYFKDPLELYVTCNGEVYSMQLTPSEVYSQKIVLKAGQSNVIKKNIAMFKGMALEKTAIDLIDKVQFERNSLPPTFKTINSVDNNWIPLTKSKVKYQLLRTIKPEGIGLQVKEYLIWTPEDTKLNEVQFVKYPIVKNMFSLRLGSSFLKKETTTKLYVVQRYWR